MFYFSKTTACAVCLECGEVFTGYIFDSNAGYFETVPATVCPNCSEDNKYPQCHNQNCEFIIDLNE